MASSLAHQQLSFLLDHRSHHSFHNSEFTRSIFGASNMALVHVSSSHFRLCSLRLLQLLTDDLGAELYELLIFNSEGSRKMAVDIQFTSHLPMHEDGNDNF